MTNPNSTLRAVRMGMQLTQEEFANKIQLAGQESGEPNDANKRLVQRWERGITTHPRPAYARALQMVTGLPIEMLGFPADADRLLVEDGRGGHDLMVREDPTPPQAAGIPLGNYSGIWRSRYEYFSSGRGEAFEGVHIAVVTQAGRRLTVRSISGTSDSTMGMNLEIDGSIVGGDWYEITESQGYYRGARYHGSVQMIVDPTGRRMSGKWLGFGRDLEINTGPWALTFESASTSVAAIARYSKAQ